MEQQQKRLGEIKEELFQALLHNQGLQELIDISYQYVENVIAVVDAGFTVIASHGVESDSMIGRQDGSSFVCLSGLQHMNEEKLMEQLYQKSHAFFFQSKFLEEKMIFAPVFINEIYVGYIAVLEINRTLSSDDLQIIDVLSDMISLEMQKSHFFSFSKKQRYEFLITGLLGGRVSDTQFFEEKLETLGKRLKENLWLVVIPFLRKNISVNQIEFSFQHLHNLFPEDLITTYNDTLVLIISKETRTPFKQYEKRRLSEFLRQHGIHAIISLRCSSILEVPVRYEQMMNLIKQLDIEKIPSVIYNYEDYMVESIFSLCEESHRLKSYIHPDLLELLEYDHKNNSKLFETLRAYLEYNRSAVRASEACKIHKSTFFYRMNKISEITGLEMQDCKKLQLYEISIKIIDYLNIVGCD